MHSQLSNSLEILITNYESTEFFIPQREFYLITTKITVVLSNIWVTGDDDLCLQIVLDGVHRETKPLNK